MNEEDRREVRAILLSDIGEALGLFMQRTYGNSQLRVPSQDSLNDFYFRTFATEIRTATANLVRQEGTISYRRIYSDMLPIIEAEIGEKIRSTVSTAQINSLVEQNIREEIRRQVFDRLSQQNIKEMIRESVAFFVSEIHKSTRCDICHKSDMFNSEMQHCSRCEHTNGNQASAYRLGAQEEDE